METSSWQSDLEKLAHKFNSTLETASGGDVTGELWRPKNKDALALLGKVLRLS
jgi:hypothetical protein